MWGGLSVIGGAVVHCLIWLRGLVVRAVRCVTDACVSIRRRCRVPTEPVRPVVIVRARLWADGRIREAERNEHFLTAKKLFAYHDTDLTFHMPEWAVNDEAEARWVKISKPKVARDFDMLLLVCNVPYLEAQCDSRSTARIIKSRPIFQLYARCWEAYLNELLVWEKAITDGRITVDVLPQFVTDIIHWMPSFVLHIENADHRSALISLISRIYALEVENGNENMSDSATLPREQHENVDVEGLRMRRRLPYTLPYPCHRRCPDKLLCRTIARLLPVMQHHDPFRIQEVTAASAQIVRLLIRGFPDTIARGEVKDMLRALSTESLMYMQDSILAKALLVLGVTSRSVATKKELVRRLKWQLQSAFLFNDPLNDEARRMVSTLVMMSPMTRSVST